MTKLPKRSHRLFLCRVVLLVRSVQDIVLLISHECLRFVLSPSIILSAVLVFILVGRGRLWHALLVDAGPRGFLLQLGEDHLAVLHLNLVLLDLLLDLFLDLLSFRLNLGWLGGL